MSNFNGGYPYSPMPIGGMQNQYGYNYGNPSFGNMNNFQQQGMVVPQKQNMPSNINTNIVYVNGLDGAKNYYLPPNSNFALWDNDSSMIFHKQVDSTGRMTVLAYDVVLHEEKQKENPANINPNDYVSRKEFEALKSDLERFKIPAQQNTQEMPKQALKPSNLGAKGV